MFDALKRWRRRRVLGRSALPDGLWAEAAEALPFVRELDDAELARLRDIPGLSPNWVQKIDERIAWLGKNG